MRHRWFYASTPIIAALAVYACSDDPSTGGATPVSLPGNDSGATSSPAPTSSPPTGDAGPGTRDASTDASDPGDAAVAPPLGSCDPPVTIDQTAGTIPQALALLAYQNKYLVTWMTSTYEIKGRYFDGTTLQPTIDLGPTNDREPAWSVDRATGKAYFLVPDSTKIGRGTFDLNDGTMKISITGATIQDQGTYDVGALAQGALAVYQSTPLPGLQLVDRYTNGGWSGEGGVDAGAFPDTSLTDQAQVALNAAGHGGVLWETNRGASGNDLYVSTFDGTNLGAPVKTNFPSNSDVAAHAFGMGALSNGDLAFSYLPEKATSLVFTIFHASTGQFDPVMTLATVDESDPTGLPKVLIDADDNITVTWVNGANNNLVVRRRIAGTWSAAVIIGHTASIPVVLDPAGNIVTAVDNELQPPTIVRMPKLSTTKPPQIPISLTSSRLAFGFDANGNPLVFGYDPTSGGNPAKLVMTTCHP